MSAQPFLHTLHAVDPATASDAQKAILDQAVKAVGFLPNMYAIMVNAPAVLSTYLHGYGLFRSESGLKPAEQEVVFLAVSQVNGCTYCTAAHSMIAEMVKTQGRPRADILQAFLAADFQERDVLYIVLAIAVKTLSNYSNHAFATPVDAVFSAYKVA